MDATNRTRNATRTIASYAKAGNRPDAADPALLEAARRWLRVRVQSGDLLPKDLRRDAAWGMLLELFVNEEEGGIVFVKQLMIASGESAAAAMRLIDRMEATALITRTPDALDHRRVIVNLTAQGRGIMLEYLSRLFSDEATASEAARQPVAYKPRSRR